MYFPSGDFSHYKSLTDVVEEHGKHMTHYHDPTGWILLMCLFNPLQNYPEASGSECLQCQPFLPPSPQARQMGAPWSRAGLAAGKAAVESMGTGKELATLIPQSLGMSACCEGSLGQWLQCCIGWDRGLSPLS